MQTVFRAEDGTIFEKEIDCEKYEGSLSYRISLIDALYKVDFPKPESFIDDLELLNKLGLAGKLINFIKSIGEQDANTIN